jgi:hypothetical protein
MHTKFRLQNLKKRRHLDDLGVDWIHLAQNMGKWCAHVNMAIKLWVP